MLLLFVFWGVFFFHNAAEIMTTVPVGFALRHGKRSDLSRLPGLYLSSFGYDSIIDIMFPGRPASMRQHLYTHFAKRFWTPGWRLMVVEDKFLGVPVGFTWWQVPASFSERWLTLCRLRRAIHHCGSRSLSLTWLLSPASWLGPLVRGYLWLKSFLTPGPAARVAVFFRVVHDAEPQFLTTQRRRDAWYLSTIALHPAFQGRKLGHVLMEDGLRRVDAQGAACWLIGLRKVETFYPRYGFAEVARINVDELSVWDGGSVMFRD